MRSQGADGLHHARLPDEHVRDGELHDGLQHQRLYAHGLQHERLHVHELQHDERLLVDDEHRLQHERLQHERLLDDADDLQQPGRGRIDPVDNPPSTRARLRART
jgi:hypothetical protein